MKAFLQRNGIHVFLIFASLFLTCYSSHARAEYRQGDGNSKINIKGRDIPVQKVFDAIRKQSGLYVMYNVGVVGVRKEDKVTVDFKDTRLDDVLSFIFNVSRYEWVYNDNAVVVRAKEIKKNDGDSSITRTSITGKVTDAEGKPLPGATVIVKGTKHGVSTDADGNFTFGDVRINSVLVISSIGFEPREIAVKGKTILAQLNVDVNDLDEAVAVAYNTTTQRASTGAVTVVKGKQIQNLPNRSFDKSLQGLVPGLLVTSGNGQPGGAPVNFILRGIATGASPDAGATVRNPLIVIDGIPVSQEPARSSGSISSEGSPVSNPMAQLNPSDIESISVLKDAAAIALYGSKASNGVILVTTKKGKTGKTVFNFRHQTDISSRLDGKVALLNQQEYLELLFEAYRNSNPGITDAAILADLRSTPSPVSSKFPTRVNALGDTSFYPAPNWNDAYYSKAAVSMTNEISMSGGNDRSNFYLNLEYTKQNGIVKNTGYDRKSIRFNYENRPTSWLKLGLNTALSYNIQDYNNQGSIEQIGVISPLNPIYRPDGQYVYNYSWGHQSSGSIMIPNPLAAAVLNINRNTAYRGLSKLYGELRFLQHFTLTSSFGVDFMLNELKEKVHPLLAIDGSLDYEGSVRQENFRNANIITNNVLQYEKTIKEGHNINLLLGQEAQILTVQNSSIEMRGLSANPSQDQPTGGNIFQAWGISGKQTLLSYFGQVNYGFRNKYFLSGSVRTDGSSRFGKNERFGMYWSVGGGWVATAEPFMKSMRSWLSYLKLRGSFGSAGNSAGIADYLRYDPLSMINYLNGRAVYPDRNRNPGNPSIQWEQTFTWDAGMELRIFDERLTATVDIYNRKTSNLIAFDIPLPSTSGFTNITDNIGDMKNSGIELSITTEIINSKDFHWSLNANWSRNRNKLVKAFYPLTSAGGYLANEVGREYNSFYLPVWAGVNPANGRPMWIDSTGKSSEDYYAAKKQFVGKAQPDGFGGIGNTFSWRGLELSAMLYYQYGSQVYYKGVFLQNDGLDPYTNQSKAALNRWQKPGDIAVNPRRLLNGRLGTEVDMGTSPSTRYLYDGDFIRLSNVALGYNFPKSILDRFHLSGLRIFVQGHNLATWTRYSGQDPENINAFGTGNFLYPQQRSYTVGLNANF
jgi:TonB-linked SusC/RagA family outer membrane protein